VPNVSFATVMAEVDAVRLNSPDDKDVRDATQRLWRLWMG